MVFNDDFIENNVHFVALALLRSEKSVFKTRNEKVFISSPQTFAYNMQFLFAIFYTLSGKAAGDHCFILFHELLITLFR